MRTLILFFAVLTFTLNSVAQTSDAIVGKWLNQDSDAHIEITKKGDQYYGSIVWLKNPNNADGTPKVDKENPDNSLKTREIIGLAILNDIVFDDDEWEDGTIYDPKSGKTYSCVIEMPQENTLKVTGYIGFSWIGRTVVWTRVQ